MPVIPVYFHGSNSFLFNFLGVACWQLRTLRLPSEVFSHHDETYHISVGDIISPEEQKQAPDLGALLRSRTYQLRERK